MFRNRTFQKSQLWILLLLSFCFTQCKKEVKDVSQQQDENQYLAFSEFISAYTSGSVSKGAVIKIRLVESNDTKQEINKVLEEKYFVFSPKIKGETYWIDDQTLAFRPDENLPADTRFNAVFDLSKVKKDVPEELEIFSFNFQTQFQSYNISFDGMESYDPNDLKWQKIFGEVTTNDIENADNVEKVLKATQNNKNLKISWEHDTNQKKHLFSVDSVVREEGDQSVELTWDGKSIGVDKKGDRSYKVPSISNFKVIDYSIQNQPDQSITIQFSDPLKPNQNLNGLIRLKSGANLRFIVEDSHVKVLPRRRQSGETELIVNTGVRNVSNYRMSENYSSNIKFENIKPAIKLVGNGVILPDANGLNFPFEAVNLKGVKVSVSKIFESNIKQFLQINQLDGAYQMHRVGKEIFNKEINLESKPNVDLSSWNTFFLDLSKFIEAEPGAVYRVKIDFEKKHAIFPCGDEEKDELTNVDSEGDYNRNRNRYDYNQRDNPCHISYYMYNNRSVTRNVFASNLGIIAKGGSSGKLHFAVTDIISTQQLSGVKIDVYDYTQQLIQSITTDAEGLASVEVDRAPYLLIAKSGSQVGYLRLDHGSSLSLSKFDVTGQKLNKGVKGFIYGERGVWRPGDDIHLNFILEDKQKVLPKSHPVIFEFFNPSGQLVYKKVKSTGVGGIYNFSTKTNTDAPTGNWLAKVTVGGSQFTKNIKVETVKPNRLKIEFDFDDKFISAYNSKTKGDMNVTWLHGAIAKNLKADVSVTLSGGKTNFDGYKGYIFDDPIHKFSADEQTIFEGTLNEEGQATINPKIAVRDAAPGMLKASFKARVFENGGEFSVDRFSIPYSPYQSYVGFKIPQGKGWGGNLTYNDTYKFPVVSVDDQGKPVSKGGIKLEVYKVSWRWWWESSYGESLSRYVNSSYYKPVFEDEISTTSGVGEFEMSVNSYGRYLIRLTDLQSGHSTGKVVYFYWGRNSRGADNPGGATMLTFNSDKSTYNVGEDINITFPSAAEGKALVSLETGSKVIRTFWVDPKDNQTTFSFKATSDMAPNVYAHITLLQPHNYTKNDLPIRLYGVQRIKVEDPATHLKPVLNMPDELEPEQEFKIKVKEKDGKKMSYTIAVVDEGLLDLTRFRTPKPWSKFYTKEALGVKTWDMYDKVMGAYAGEMAGLLQIGGDDEVNPKGGKKANRFKPVVHFIGPFLLEEGDEKTHTIKMPNYVGSVKTMVVAGYEGAYGASDKVTPVRKPLMVLATLPRVLGPAETVKLPVSVFAMDDKVKDVKVSIEANDYFEVTGGTSQSVKFSEPGDQIINFDIKVKEKVGIGKVKIVATGSGEKASYDIEIDVRNPNPRVTEVVDLVIDNTKTWYNEYQPVGVDGTNKTVLEISNIPSLNLDNRLNYLIRYPHGCIEQTTSSVFPQLYLSEVMELDKQEVSRIDNNIKAGIKRIATQFQLVNGGLSYWPGNSEANDWGSNYGGHFMVEAQNKGYVLPSNFLKSWIRYQKRQADSWSSRYTSGRNYYDLIQAYRLYTLALAKSPSLGAMNRLREKKRLSNQAKWRLAAAYQLIGQTEVANKLIADADTKIESYKELSYTYGSTLRDEAMILESLSLSNKRQEGKKMLDIISEKLSTRSWYSTQTTAYCLIAIGKFISSNRSGKKLAFSYKIDSGKSVEVDVDKPVYRVNLPVNPKNAISIVNKSGGVLFGKLIKEGVPVTGDQTDSNKDLNMVVAYFDLDGKKINPARLVQGTDFMVEVTIIHPGRSRNYSEMALTQIFPSGWEIRNFRMDGVSSTYKSDIPEYQDIRDDRVYTYFDINSTKSKKYKILLNASYLGRFYLPTTYCEAMYDNEIYARRAGKWVEVVRADDSLQK